MSTTERAEFMRPRADGAEQTPWARVDEEGRIVIPAGLAARLGLTPGAEMRVELLANGLRLHRPITHLARLYIEPTTACNLLCRTCFRNAWEEPAGFMSEETFAAILDGLAQLDVVPTVHFGGIGEPLFHPRTIAWIGRVKQLGGQVELITNGTLLTEECSRALIAAGLDLLWVSIDGATPESYADVRLGAELSGVIANVSLFRKLRRGAHHPKPEIGIAFVAMKRNIGELPQVLRLGRQLGARHFMVSNVQPTTADLQEEMLCTRSMHDLAYLPSATVPRLSLPKMDMDEITRDALFQAFNSGYNVSYAGANWGNSNDVCNYIESGSMSVAWNGDVSPCWPLLHTHTSYLHGKPRRSVRHIVGNVRERSLRDLWLDEAYVAYRRRVQSFAFPPCTFCGGCDVSGANEEDCFDNPPPVCGGCLWAQGLVQCP